MNRDALLEILVENLPPGWVAPAAERLKKLAAQELAAAGLACGAPEAYGTCRRLVLYLPGLPAGAAAKALASVFPRLVERLEFPSSMAWEPSGFRFARPIRGLLALHGERLVSFSLAGVKSGRVTEGQEAAGPRRVKVPSAERYFKALEHAAVLVKDAERLAALRGGLEAAAARMKLSVEMPGDLLLENLYLAERPVVVVSAFSQEFLALPPEQVRAALRELAFFPVSDGAGRLQPYFAGVRDGSSKGQRNAEEGFRAALESRLAAVPSLPSL